MKKLVNHLNESFHDINRRQASRHYASEEVIFSFLNKNYNFVKNHISITNENGVNIVNCKTYIEVKNKNITDLTEGIFEFGKVNGDFDCSGCDKLYSLEGAPKIVCGTFDCSKCNLLKRLIGAPETVYGNFDCSECKSLCTLDGISQYIGGSLICKSCIKLTSFYGCPDEIGKNLDCSYCTRLSNFKDAPKKIYGKLFAFECPRLRLTKDDLKNRNIAGIHHQSMKYMNESKQLDYDELYQLVKSCLDTIYTDGYNSPSEAKRALRDLAYNGDSDMLDYLTSTIDAHDGNITEDDLLDNWDEYVEIAMTIAKEML